MLEGFTSTSIKYINSTVEAINKIFEKVTPGYGYIWIALISVVLGVK